MKRYEGDSFKAMMMNGSVYLMTHSYTLDGVREEIDRSNERAVSLGYKADHYLIVHEEWYKWYLDDGTFFRSETYETTVGVYPQKGEEK